MKENGRKVWREREKAVLLRCQEVKSWLIRYFPRGSKTEPPLLRLKSHLRVTFLFPIFLGK